VSASSNTRAWVELRVPVAAGVGAIAGAATAEVAAVGAEEEAYGVANSPLKCEIPSSSAEVRRKS